MERVSIQMNTDKMLVYNTYPMSHQRRSVDVKPIAFDVGMLIGNSVIKHGTFCTWTFYVFCQQPYVLLVNT